MTESINPADRRTEIALARYTLILPIVRETGRRERHQMRQNIAATIHDFPHGIKNGVSVTTLYRWEKMYRQGGFDALKPQARQDKPSRVISAETLDRAEALKRAQPFRSARAIINILEMDRENPIPEKSLTERTLRRQLTKRGATTAQLTVERQPKAYRRFERNAFGDLWQGDALHG
ncbi:MAG: helix-turn-helix domain-containing protein, partial [Gammaproteobacteria bacterium]|nr:helix-turn-helix domain-containing protein [Gammaproteobacteria bacterium]